MPEVRRLGETRSRYIIYCKEEALQKESRGLSAAVSLGEHEVRKKRVWRACTTWFRHGRRSSPVLLDFRGLSFRKTDVTEKERR